MNSPIRRLDVHRDLSEAADLIEMCFGSQMDPDGHTYLRNIRRAARNNDHLRWLPGPAEQATYPLFGYVWEENHKIIGNISLIPVLFKGSWRYLIANVAVHPDYRGKRHRPQINPASAAITSNPKKFIWPACKYAISPRLPITCTARMGL